MLTKDECGWCPKCRQIITYYDVLRGMHPTGAGASERACATAPLKVDPEIQAAFQLGGRAGARAVMMQKLGREDG